MLAERKAEAVERYRKKDMLQTVDTLLRANDAILKTVRSNPQGAAEALVQCQESAIALGTYIDTLDEKYTSLVHVLEDYCENIYQMSENLSDENLCRKVSKKIQKQLTGLQNSIKYDLPEDRKEVVFLPYKASMWDSLESVWKAADADENTDAYVIPIPYFDKNPDGTFKEEHYEGDQYPAYVPVTRYDEYDLKTRRPDVIYIHNPYDECNHVTSVHPYFYSKNLRNFTDKLVYIPYFILGEIGPDNQPAIDGMKHFCFMPGTIYADQVIVQSENMRQIYINEYIKAAKEMGLSGEHVDRKSLEKKFLGTGSPKIDKVLNTRKEDLEIPAEWLRVIEKPDGSWKKIVFYNTSVSALLQHSEKMLRKMESVFEIFKENRDEVALLWRPHPLIQATIESMRPQLWEGYQEIRDRYVAEGWGIYDDTADLDRAVVLSDAYYGDGSSVLLLCRKAGIPVMIQCVNILYNRKCEIDYLWSYNFYIENENIWFVPFWYNRLCKFDLKKGKISFDKKILCPNEIEGLYSNLFKVENSIILVPENANEICIYDLEEERFTAISLSERRQSNDKFNVSVRYGNVIYMFPGRYSVICKVDISNKEVTYLSDEFIDQQCHNNCDLFRWSHYVKGNMVYLLKNGSNCIFKFDMSAEKSELIPIGDADENYQTINGDENGNLYLSNLYGNVVMYNENTKKLKKKEYDNLDNIGNRQGGFISSEIYGDQIFYFPKCEGKCRTFNIINEDWEEVPMLEQLIEKGETDEKGYTNRFSQIWKDQKALYGFNIEERYFFQMDLCDHSVKKIFINYQLNKKDLQELFEDYEAAKYGAQLESTSLYFNLEAYIEMIIDKSHCKEANFRELVGMKIYRDTIIRQDKRENH